MTIIIATDRKKAEKEAEKHPNSLIVSPDHPTIHGMDKVILIGSFPEMEKRYQGICPVEIVNLNPRPRKEVIHAGSDRDIPDDSGG